MKFSALTPDQRTVCFKLLGTIQGRLEYIGLSDRHAVDVMLLELENELSASRPSGGVSPEPAITPAMVMGTAPLKALMRMGGYAAVFGDDEAVSLFRQIMSDVDAELMRSSDVSLTEFLAGR